jgi:hypothetical protein
MKLNSKFWNSTKVFISSTIELKTIMQDKGKLTSNPFPVGFYLLAIQHTITAAITEGVYLHQYKR